MAIILKNNTASPVSIDDVGQTVPASGQLTIQATDELLYKGSSDVVTLVGNSTLTVNDGNEDLSISSGIDLIKDIFPSEIIINQNKAQLSAFNDQMSESMQPITQISATYGLDDPLIETFIGDAGGTVDTNDNMFVCETGTSLGGFGVIRTKKPTLYREGQGLMWRGTAIFSAGVSNSLQFAGLFNLDDTLAFGYRGTDFGIIYENYGSPEIRTLTVNDSGNGTLTLTLNGVSYNIPITSGTTNHNAHEISNWLNNNQTIWETEQRENIVYFQAQDTSLRNGTYSISGTTLTGTFTQVKAGKTKDINDILQTNWDNNPSWFDPTKSNVYMIKLSYLGFGPIRFFIMNTNSGEWELVHTIKPLGVVTKPSISSRALKSGWVAASLGSTTNITVKGASAGTFIEGDSKVFGEAKSSQATNSSVGSTYVSLLTLRCNRIFSNQVNLGRLTPISLNLANDSTKPVEYLICKNCTLGETNFIDYKSNSIASIDKSNFLVTNNGEDILSGVMSPNGAPLIDLEELDIQLELGDYITIYARKRSGTNPEVNCSITWKEDV